MTERTRPDRENGSREIPKQSVTSVQLLDPTSQVKASDPIFGQLIDGAWRDTQQHGREVYNAMMQHTAVSAPFDMILSIIKSLNFEFRAQQSSPTDKQKEMADFLNAQISRLGMQSDYKSGWTKFIDGFIGQALQYGFSLAEISTVIEDWDGRPYIQIDNVQPIPQRSLDRSWGGETSTLGNGAKDLQNFNYNCFDFNDDGDIRGYIQNAQQAASTSQARQDPEIPTWYGNRKKQILHYTHKGGDGNPYGESLLWRSYYPWADLYTAERLEQWKLENADSFLTMSYDSDTPLPEVHDQVVKQISESGDGVPVLVAPRSEWGNVSVVSEQYTQHIKQRKNELHQEIAQGMLVPQSVFTETETGDVDSRNLIQTFFKFRLPSLLNEITEVLTWQFGKRLIDANYSNLDPEDYPVARARIHLDNDLRVMSGLVQQIIPYLDSERLGEFAEELMPGFQMEWFPEDHEDSVAAKRPLDEHAPQDVPVVENDDNPPPKQPGETREDQTGQTESVGQETDTVA